MDRDRMNLGRLQRLLTSNEPAELRTYLSVPSEGSAYQIGSTVKALGGFRRVSTGLWVPNGSVVASGPLDFARTYLTISDVIDAHISLDWVRGVLNRTPITSVIELVARAMAKIRGGGNYDGARELDTQSLPLFTEPARSRLARRLDEDSLIHAPQLLMVLAKLAIAECPDEVKPEDFYQTSLALLLLVVADNLNSPEAPSDSEPTVSLTNNLVLEMAANTNFNSSYREDSQLALFQRRWVEIPRELPSGYCSRPLDEMFKEATGLALGDLASLALGLWASCIGGNPIVHFPTYFAKFGWDRKTVDDLIGAISMTIQDYRPLIRRELVKHPLDWYFTTFARYPLIRFGEYVAVLDPELLLKRCLGLPPMFHMQQMLEEQGRGEESIAVKQAFDEYSEIYAKQTFESFSGAPGVRRVYSDRDLKRSFRGLSVADVVVDYGDAWIVVEVTTSQVSRNTVNAVSVDGLERDRKTILREAAQVSATIDQLRSSRGALIGRHDPLPVTFYPIIVLTEGFPANPLMNTLMRQEIRQAGLLTGSDVAPVEFMDLVELDMIEGIAEGRGRSLPEILRYKLESNFHADSVRNFLIGDRRFEPRRPKRVTETFQRVFAETIRKLGADPDAIHWRKD